ncbi:MAG TPA: DUF192 domain-containing protein [Gammaproteobacteria bacterium]|nr:DUF192 domain-containing protein [Gammaproteobacteria bacterium]
MGGKWIIASFFAVATAQAAPYHLPPHETNCTVSGHSFPVHIAATVAERATGFAGAPPELIEHAAILFVYPPEDARVSSRKFSFGGGANQPPSGSVNWYFNMRHMLAPLDIAFMNRDGRVLAVLRMVPGPELYRPRRPYAAALEIAADRAAMLGLRPGAQLTCGQRVPEEVSH